MRILHTGDWHLGRIFYGRHLTDDQAHALAQLIDIARHERPDVVVVAGDIYDRAVPPPEAVDLLDDVISELVLDLGLPLVAISGNHDSARRLGYGSRMLRRQRLHVHTELLRDPQPVTFSDAHGPVDFWCVPYCEPSLVRQVHEGCTARTHDTAFTTLTDAIAAARARLPDAAARRSVLVAHLHAEGGEASDSERPLVFGSSAVVGLDRFDAFDYVALGHLHKPQFVGSSRHVRYSGSILKYSFSEWQDEKGICMVELGPPGEPARVEHLPLRARHDVKRISGAFDALLDPATAPEAGSRDYFEITLSDQTPILDAMARLRAVYPNLLHVRREDAAVPELVAPSAIDHREANIETLFADFFENVTTTPLSDDERAALAGVLAELDAAARESDPSANDAGARD